MSIWGELSIFISDDFEGHWPVGTSAVIVARDEEEARKLLQTELDAHGFAGRRSVFTLRKIQTDKPQAFVINDGDY